METVSQPASATSAPHEVRAILTQAWCLFAFAMIFVWLGFGSYLIEEHQRLVWYEILGIWTGDVLAFLWFAHFTVRWFFNRLPMTEIATQRLPISVWFGAVSIAVGVAAEYWLAHAISRDEEQAFKRAVPVIYTVTSITAINGSAPTFWKLMGNYVDAAGTMHVATYRIPEKDVVRRFPRPLVQSILNSQTPLVVPLVIDPVRPSRHWIPQLGWDDPNRFHKMSLLILLLQVLFSIVFFGSLHRKMTATGLLPWYAELHRIMPLVIEASFFAVFGVLEVFLIKVLSH